MVPACFRPFLSSLLLSRSVVALKSLTPQGSEGHPDEEVSYCDEQEAPRPAIGSSRQCGAYLQISFSCEPRPSKADEISSGLDNVGTLRNAHDRPLQFPVSRHPPQRLSMPRCSNRSAPFAVANTFCQRSLAQHETFVTHFEAFALLWQECSGVTQSTLRTSSHGGSARGFLAGAAKPRRALRKDPGRQLRRLGSLQRARSCDKSQIIANKTHRRAGVCTSGLSETRLQWWGRGTTGTAARLCRLTATDEVGECGVTLSALRRPSLPGSAAVSFRSGKSGKEGSSSMSATACPQTAGKTKVDTFTTNTSAPASTAISWANHSTKDVVPRSKGQLIKMPLACYFGEGNFMESSSRCTCQR